MALDRSNLTSLAYGNGFTLWHYTTTDAVADVNTSGYFDNASNQLSIGDRIMATTSTGTTSVYTDIVVLTNASGVVDVSDGVVLAVTDTD